MARSSAVITIPGVLQKLVTAAPIPVGIQLYNGLAETFNLLLVTDDSQEKTDYWLKLENLNRHGTVLYGDSTGKAQGSNRVKQINTLRSRGFALDLVVEPDPKIAAELLRSGYNVCNFLHSAYAYPTWRPDFEGKEKRWEEIATQVEIDRAVRAGDVRIEDLWEHA